MKLFHLVPFALPLLAQKGGKGSGGGDHSPGGAHSSPVDHTITHTYTWEYLISSFVDFPQCSLTRVNHIGTSSTVIVVQATNDAQASQLVEDMVKKTGLPTSRITAEPGARIFPTEAQISVSRSENACVPIVTGSSRAGSGAASTPVVTSSNMSWLLVTMIFGLGGLMIAL